MPAAYAEVAVGVPLDVTFHYTVPPALSREVTVGRRVLVPFGKRKASGWVVGRVDAPPPGFEGEIKPILQALDDGPILTEDELSLYRWIAEYYQHPLGLVLKTALPAGLEKGRVQPKTERVFITTIGHGEGAWGRRVQRDQLGMWDDALIGRLKKRAPAQAAVLEALLAAGGSMSAGELRELQGDRGVAAANGLVNSGHLLVDEREVMRSPLGSSALTAHEPATPPPLTPAQAAALADIEAALRAGRFAPALLQGVTGSGKTEVYLRAIATAIELKKTALVLVPEIALTPQLVGRFRARFGDAIAVLHSGLSDGQRYDEWRRIRRNEVRIAVGARSAVFAPLTNLGIVVVDEEHDGSYKQEEGLRYHARDVAVVRAQKANAVVVLGSATPSLETFHNADTKKYARLVLPVRVGDRAMPEVELVKIAGRRKGPLSARLREALEETLRAKKQSILLLNRRGYAPSIVCDACGHVFRCGECAVSMIFHAPALAKKRKSPQGDLFEQIDPDEVTIADVKGWLTCHYCGLRAKTPGSCPECRSADLRLLGVGTQRLERELGDMLPGVRIARMDRDTTARKGAHEKILERLAAGEVDVLLGTQMIAKGLDFPGVTLVGVVLADTALHLADFRGAERTFQLLTQVAGRAGRGEHAGKVIVQSYHPEHYAIARAAEHDFEGFARHELQIREELFYPPFSRLVNLRVSSGDREAVERASHALRERLSTIARGRDDLRVVGPAPAPLAMLRGRHRWHVLVRGATGAAARQAATRAVESLGKAPGDVRIEIDVDPQSLL